MNVTIHTLEGLQTLEGIHDIVQFDNVIVFADLNGIEYHSLNDFPTMFRFEVTIDPEGE